MGYQLTLFIEEHLEGGYTITCKELPELLTECDSLDEMKANVIDAFMAVLDLYEYRQRPLPKSIQCADEDITDKDTRLLETVVAFNEISTNSQKANQTWL